MGGKKNSHWPQTCNSELVISGISDSGDVSRLMKRTGVDKILAEWLKCTITRIVRAKYFKSIFRAEHSQMKKMCMSSPVLGSHLKKNGLILLFIQYLVL